MALARVKTWIEEILRHGDLNSEFNNILNNPIALISPYTAAVDWDGYAQTLDAAGVTTLVSSASVSFNFTSGAKSGTPATTGSVANWSAQTFTDSATAASGTAAAWVGFGYQRPTLAATNGSVTTTDAATVYIANSPAAGTNETITNAWSLWVDAGNVRLDGNLQVRGGTIDTASTTALSLATSGGTQVQITNTAAAANYWGFTGAAASGDPTMLVAGSDANITVAFKAKGTGDIRFFSDSGSKTLVRMHGDGVTKLAGSAQRATTEGTNHLDIFDGTAPVGTLAAGISLYSTSGELRVMDSGGTATLLSPHDKKTNEWIFDSVNTQTGKGLRIDMERLIRAINERFGWDFVHEFEI